MKSKFENQIRDSILAKGGDGSFEPNPGHEARFKARLHHRDSKRTMHRLPTWSLIALAAACVVGLIIGIVIREMKKEENLAERARLSDVSIELARVEDYYHQRLMMDSESHQMKDQNIRKFMSDIRRLESEYAMLEEKLTLNFHNERIAEAMVNNYRYRLQLLQQMQKYIEIQNKINTQDNEQKMSS